MRSLAHDLGEALGCGGHVTDLERRNCGGFSSDAGVTLEELEADAQEPDGWRRHLHPVDWVVRDMKTVTVGPAAEKFLRNGQSVSLGRADNNAGYLEQFRAYDTAGHFLALVRFDRAGQLMETLEGVQLQHPLSIGSNIFLTGSQLPKKEWFQVYLYLS